MSREPESSSTGNDRHVRAGPSLGSAGLFVWSSALATACSADGEIPVPDLQTSQDYRHRQEMAYLSCAPCLTGQYDQAHQADRFS